MAGYAPQLFLNGKVIDIRYAPTRAKIAQDRKKAAQRRLQLIDLPARLHDVSLSEIDVTDDRNNVLALIYDFLKKYKKDPHQKGLYLSGDFGVGKTYILAGLANYVVTNMNKTSFSCTCQHLLPALLVTLTIIAELACKKKSVDYPNAICLFWMILGPKVSANGHVMTS